MEVLDKVLDRRPEIGLEGEQQHQADHHRGREEEQRQRGRAGEVEGQDHQVVANTPRNSTPMPAAM